VLKRNIINSHLIRIPYFSVCVAWFS